MMIDMIASAARRFAQAAISMLMKFSSGAFVALAFCQVAIAAESLFYSQCYKQLPIADDFANECKQRARPFSRTFYPGGGSRGELESYSAYFKALDAPSHFVLGCVLDFRHQINFAGLYYSAQPLDMSKFESYPIAFIDPGDNVGLQIDGAQHTFVAVRQFVTKLIPARLRLAPKDCEDPKIESVGGVAATAEEHFRALDEGRMEYCLGDACRPVKYRAFGVHEAPIVYSYHDLFMVDGNGVLMLKDDYFRDVCATWKRPVASEYNLIYEMCSKVN